MNTMLFFTSDTHFDHDNIRKYCNRPFDNVKEMNETMIANWNSVVGPKDTVYHLGDFAFSKDYNRIIDLWNILNGRKTLVLGNHDRLLKKFVSQGKGPFGEVRRLIEMKWDHKKIILCHYSMRVWNSSHHGSWHLYGHSHGTLDEDPRSRSFDVGVDCWNFTPVSYGQICEKMQGIEEYIAENGGYNVDHHKEKPNV